MKLNTDFMSQTFLKTLGGIHVTFEITIVALLFAVPFGFIIAIICIRKVPVLCQIFHVYISLVRAAPTILLILLAYNSFPKIIATFANAAGIEYDVYGIDPIVYAIILFALIETAILSEVFRAALSTVDKSQLEAAESIGMTKAQGYLRIVIPQALTAAVPVLCSSVTDLIKMTSLAFAMTVMEITAIAKIEASSNLAYIEAYLVLAIVYFIVIFTIERLLKIFERKLRVYQNG